MSVPPCTVPNARVPDARVPGAGRDLRGVLGADGCAPGEVGA